MTRRLALPYLLVMKPEWELFPGAVSAYEFYTLFPDGRVLETGNVNNLGQSFSRVFGITFEKEDGTREFVYQTCYGQSERLLASLVSIHGDDHGLVLPSSIAPKSAVMVPILHSKSAVEVLDYAEIIEKTLNEEGVSVELDRRDLTSGEKYYYWEKRGIQIRIEIGPKEKKEDIGTIVPRHNLRRKKIARQNLAIEIKRELDKLEKELLEKAETQLKERIGYAVNSDDVSNLVREGKPILNVPSCGKQECNERIEEMTGMENIGFSTEKSVKPMRCLGCNEETTRSCYMARSY